jgi:hypothetical protein
MDTPSVWDELSPVDRALYEDLGVAGPEYLELAFQCMHETMQALAREPIKFFEAYRHATNLLAQPDKLRIMARHVSLLKVAPDE